MKTLRKTLSLTLVFALVFSLMSFAFAADTTTTTTGYTDAASITYKEAVDVATAIGVFQGNDSKAFAPKDNLTREQAAKVITYLTMGKAAADKLSASADPFTDVPAARWSAGSIAYCKQQGIIAGYGDGKFGPTDTVTGYQFAKMLLVAIGYDATIEGFNGADWQVNVAKRAFANKLSDGNDAFAGTNAANREEAALYVKNTLLAGLVTYDTKGTNIKLPDGTTVNTGASAPKQNTGSFMASYYTSLKLDNTSADSFGRPANNWTYKGNDVGTYASVAAFTYTADMTDTAGIATIAKALTGYTLHTTNNVVDANIVYNGTRTALLNASFATTIANATGNGTLVQVYVAKDTKIITGVTVIKSDFAQIKSINTTSKTIYMITGSATPVQGSYTVAAADNATLYAKLAAISVDTPVIVTPVYSATAAKYVAASVDLPTTVVGKVTSTTGAIGATDSITVNSKAYEAAAAANATVAAAAVNTSGDATLVLDPYGYVVYFKGTTAGAATCAMVVASYKGLVNNQVVDMAKLAFNDGTTADVHVAAPATAGDFVTFSVANSTYTLSAQTPVASAGSNGAMATTGTYVQLQNGGSIQASDKALDNTSSALNTTNYYGNYYASDVKFIFVNTSASTATVKTGVQDVASITSSGAQAYSVAVIGTTTATGTTPVVTAVYILNGVAASVDSNSIVYFKSIAATGSTTVKGTDGTTDVTLSTYTGYVNGEKVTMPLTGAPTADKFYAFTKNANSSYTLGSTPYAAAGAGVTSSVVTSNAITAVAANRYITVGGAVVDASTATVVDARTAAQKAADPIDASLYGLLTAVQAHVGYGNAVNVAMIYNGTTNNATVIYITGAPYATAPAAFTTTNNVTLSFSAAPASANAGDTVVVTGTLGGSAASAATKIVISGVTGTLAGTPTNATFTGNTQINVANGVAASGTFTFTYVVPANGALPVFTGSNA